MNSNPHNINGVLLLDKALGCSSNHALQKVKRLYSASKAGHAGSLDPLATGMLPICFGGALKFIEFLIGNDKRYRVTGTLGITTTTGDKEGEIIATRDHQHVTTEMLVTILRKFEGSQQQIPPMFSALKHQGKPLYKLAREGKVIERKARDIVLHELACIHCSDNTFTLDVHCSSGTYIRTLVSDIGEALQCGAHVSALHRTQVAHYPPANMISLEQLEKTDDINAYLLPIETILEEMPSVQVSHEQCLALLQGQSATLNRHTPAGIVKLLSERNIFLGVAEVLPDSILKPRKIYPWNL
jgi:tRNA pseudouridine55 synthase